MVELSWAATASVIEWDSFQKYRTRGTALNVTNNVIIAATDIRPKKSSVNIPTPKAAT